MSEHDRAGDSEDVTVMEGVGVGGGVMVLEVVGERDTDTSCESDAVGDADADVVSAVCERSGDEDFDGLSDSDGVALRVMVGVPVGVRLKDTSAEEVMV